MIAYASQKKRDSLNKIKDLEKEIKLKENQLSEHYSESQYQELCKLKFQLHKIYNKKVACALFRIKNNFYEGGEKTGEILAGQVKQKNFSNTIPAIKQPFYLS